MKLESQYPGIYLATEDEWDIVRSIIVTTFETDPQINWLASPNPTKKRREALIDYSLDEAFEIGSIYLTDDHQGVAVWVPTDAHRLSWRSIRRDLRFLFTMGVRSSFRNLGGLKDVKANAPKGRPSLYLCMIGVLEVARGRGLSSKLLSPILNAAAEANSPVILETAKLNNVGLYKRKNFFVDRVVPRSTTCTTYYMKWLPEYVGQIPPKNVEPDIAFSIPEPDATIAPSEPEIRRRA